MTAKHSQNWYDKQKQKETIIYILSNCINNDTYIGSTRNSLQKRMYQHRSKGGLEWLHKYMSEIGLDNWIIEEIERVPHDKGKLHEQLAINKYQPSLNKNRAVKSPVRGKKCYKGGCEVFGKWYKTKKDAHKEHGVTCYNTFKRRLHRGMDIETALTAELKHKSKAER